MKTKAALLSAVLILLAGSTSAATLFRIVVEGQDGAIVTSSPPVIFGSTVLVRRADGTSMTIPANLVLSVSKATTTRSLATSLGRSVRLANPAGAGTAISISGNTGSARLAAGALTTARAATTATNLLPGQTLVLGQTGATASTGIGNRPGTAIAAADTIVVSPRAGTPLGEAGTALSLSANPLGASIERQVFQGDLVRDTARTSLTPGMNATPNGDFIIGPNGFPVPITIASSTAATAQTVIGPNGFPVPITAASATASAGQTVIGPNGFPVPATTAQTAPQTVVPVIGANGFPTTAATASGPAVQTGLTRGIATVPATSSGATTSGAAGAFGSPAMGAATVSTTGAAAPSSGGASGSPQ